MVTMQLLLLLLWSSLLLLLRELCDAIALAFYVERGLDWGLIRFMRLAATIFLVWYELMNAFLVTFICVLDINTKSFSVGSKLERFLARSVLG